jgi:membrane-bound lytic murein transglycosylase B
MNVASSSRATDFASRWYDNLDHQQGSTSMGSSDEQLGQIGTIAGVGAVGLLAIWGGAGIVSMS